MTDTKRKKKTLQDLTLKDNFMFGAVMIDEENCRNFLELVLGFPIARVMTNKEKSIVYHPEYRGVRLDIYASDENNTRYDVEMQIAEKTAISRRSRYYHSQMDMELLLSGEDYELLPDMYVIFVCDFDPFGAKKYRYTFRNLCEEKQKLSLDDGIATIFLSTYGENEEEVSEELVEFLHFVKAEDNGITESKGKNDSNTAEFKSKYVKHLSETVERIKKDREMEGRFMLFEELLKDEREEGRTEGMAEGQVLKCTDAIMKILNFKGVVSNALSQKISDERDLSVLDFYLEQAVKASSVEEFTKAISR